MSTVSQLFNSPAADVWRVIADGWLYSGWVVGTSRIRAVDDQWPAEGARLHHSVGGWPLVIDDSTQVTAVEPGRRLEVIARGWPMGEAKVVMTLEDRGNLPVAKAPEAEAVVELLENRGVKFTSWEGWLALDAHELALGAAATEAGGSHGVEVKRERIKVVPREEMVEISRDGVAAQV